MISEIYAAAATNPVQDLDDWWATARWWALGMLVVCFAVGLWAWTKHEDELSEREAERERDRQRLAELERVVAERDNAGSDEQPDR